MKSWKSGDRGCHQRRPPRGGRGLKCMKSTLRKSKKAVAPREGGVD